VGPPKLRWPRAPRSLNPSLSIRGVDGEMKVTQEFLDAAS